MFFCGFKAKGEEKIFFKGRRTNEPDGKYIKLPFVAKLIWRSHD